MKTLKALGALLCYPSRDLVQALPEIHAVIVEEGRVGRRGREALRQLMKALGGADLLDLEEAYVATFDRGRATSLHLFEHVHGDSRDRGQAMVDLRRVYERAGLRPDPRELPDFLPLFLEFLAGRPETEVREMLGDCAHILRAIGEALLRHDSPYAAVPGALLDLIGESPLRLVPKAPAEAPEKTLDEEWAEAPAFDGGDLGASCAASGKASGASGGPGSRHPSSFGGR